MIRALFLVAGIVVLGVLLWHLGPADIARTFAQLGWHALPILVCYGLYQAMRALALKLSILHSRQVSFWDALWIRFSGDAMQALTFSGPFVGEPTKAWLLKRRGLSLAEGFAATLTAAVLNLVVGAVMGSAGLAYLLRHGALPPPAAAAAVALICVNAAFLLAVVAAVGMRYYLIGSAIGWLGRTGILWGRLKPNVEAINTMEDVLLGILHDRPARAAAILLAEAGGQLALVLELAWILRALEIATPAIYPLAIEASTKFITVVFFFMPLQLGTAEGSYAVIFGALGLPVAVGFSVAFFRRFRSLLVASAGLAAMNALTRERGHDCVVESARFSGSE